MKERGPSAEQTVKDIYKTPAVILAMAVAAFAFIFAFARG
jgi:hypothetical protein